MISTTEELQSLADLVRQSPWVALDTEADSLHAYPEKLCLIQIAHAGGLALVDPLSDLHLEPLWSALDGREVIFHAADYDLRLMSQGHHFVPASVFDTMLAARLLGLKRFGLNDVLQHYLGITLEKGSQKANWGRRPLTDRMIEYALNDVRHLAELVERMRAELARLGRAEWHQQVCARLVREATRPVVDDPEDVWRIKGHDKLDRTGLAVLRAIWHWREQDALRTGKPPFFILNHEWMTGISAAAATGGPARLRLPGFLTPKRRNGLLDAVRSGLATPPAELPDHIRQVSRRMSRREIARTEALRIVRDAHARRLGIDPTLIASKTTLYALAREDTGAWEALLPWQANWLKTPVSAEDLAEAAASADQDKIEPTESDRGNEHPDPETAAVESRD